MAAAFVQEHYSNMEKVYGEVALTVSLRGCLPGREDSLPVTCEIAGNRYYIAGGLIVCWMLDNSVQYQVIFKIDRVAGVFPA